MCLLGPYLVGKSNLVSAGRGSELLRKELSKKLRIRDTWKSEELCARCLRRVSLNLEAEGEMNRSFEEVRNMTC